MGPNNQSNDASSARPAVGCVDGARLCRQGAQGRPCTEQTTAPGASSTVGSGGTMRPADRRGARGTSPCRVRCGSLGEDGVLLVHEHIAHNPERAVRRRDVDAHEGEEALAALVDGVVTALELEVVAAEGDSQ